MKNAAKIEASFGSFLNPEINGLISCKNTTSKFVNITLNRVSHIVLSLHTTMDVMFGVFHM